MQSHTIDKLNTLEELPFRYPVYQGEPWKSRDVRQIFAGIYCGFYFVNIYSDIGINVLKICYKMRDINIKLTAKATLAYNKARDADDEYSTCSRKTIKNKER